MKSTFLLLFVSVSSALVLYDSGEESLLKTELMDTGFPANTNYMKSNELPGADKRLFYGLLKFHKNNTTEQDLNTKNAPETKAVKSGEIKRSKSNKVMNNSYSARKWYLKKGKGMLPTHAACYTNKNSYTVLFQNLLLQNHTVVEDIRARTMYR